jgi:hypothetical protein
LLILALVARIDLAFLATAHGEFTAKGINRSGISTIIDTRSQEMTKACPGMDGQAFAQ